MIVGVPTASGDEARVAVVPGVAEDLLEDGHEVLVEAGAGETAGFDDDAYREAGCDVLDDRAAVFDRADVIFEVEALGAIEDGDAEVYREGQTVIGLLGPYEVDDDVLETLAERQVSAFALELIPRISRAQSMDALSSMANLAGYKATVLAASELDKLVPMQMTAAGTVQPADVFVIGAGVAGLQAITTADRLGASVRAYDIRPEAAEEIESVGADFVELDVHADDAADEEGHAQEMDEEFYRKQRAQLGEEVAEADVVITTAAIPGGPAPRLVTEEAVAAMDHGSVIVDLAADGGGNCDVTEADERVEYEGVTVFGPTNLPSTLPRTASDLYANNLRNLFDLLVEEGDLAIDTDDEIVDATLLTHDGTVRAPHEDDGETDGDDETDAGEGATDADEANGDGTADENGDDTDDAADRGDDAETNGDTQDSPTDGGNDA
ncbi:NAD transhydrogenase subunit alpha protein [Halorhabdus tiamatea SARL4B]|uniref:proton-translocating NAD(P)(+) transhydrogenase n=1 Tax=Halorhabdus tiamatea SARL4B TaxID=1033806 RepID=U2F7V3_9EURY|nr:Re/Si-specific NAD(P)(+) transhydrogenase subunit alpha [Halorhabdus tiamatea]ERJ06235.1 NAD transhydrogenase subunit alpha protein [Halorhabdus tiamatea SARL4B]